MLQSGQLAEKCRVSSRTIERLAARYQIPGTDRTRKGKHWRFDSDAILFVTMLVNSKNGPSPRSPGWIARQRRIRIGTTLLLDAPKDQVRNEVEYFLTWIKKVRGKKHLLSVAMAISEEIQPLLFLPEFFRARQKEDWAKIFDKFSTLVVTQTTPLPPPA